MIKLFAWDGKSMEKLNTVRAEELVWIRYNKLLGVINTTVNVSTTTFDILL